MKKERRGDTSNTSSLAHPQDTQTNGHVDSEEEESSDYGSITSSPRVRLQKITFRVRMPKPSVQSLGNVPLPKKYCSFEDFLEKDELDTKPGEDTLTPIQASREAKIRQEVRKAEMRGKAIAKKLEESLPDPQREPDKQWAHYDHLIAHLRHFRRLLRNEHQAHRRQAKKIAEEAVKYLEVKRQKNKVKTVEEIEQEETAKVVERCRQVIKDIEKQWALVESEVNRFRQLKWEEEQQALGKEHLNRVLEQHTQMLESRLARESSDVDSGDDDSRQNADEDSDSTSEEEGESNMSTDESETEDEQVADDKDAELTTEQLLQKYASLPATPGSENRAENEQAVDDSSMPDFALPQEHQELDSVEVDASDESDESVDMDSDIIDTSEEEMEYPDNSDEETSESEDIAGNGLLGFLSSRELAMATNVTMKDEKVEKQAENDSPASEEAPCSPMNTNGPLSEARHLDTTRATKHDIRHPRLEALVDPPSEGRVSGELSMQTSPRTSATKASEMESFSSVDPRPESQNPATPSDQKPSTIKTPVPSLLRGTLRVYQHEGLDWLADLYANNRNGILADEMGLGKTIQSIALLAHLAVEHEVWGPHLIIVPTSVMLNWEMEFKKFCPGFKILTYYGTQEERRQKRRGWQRDDLWNVCITSYQLVLQDQTVFKRRNWHYMILDEAHNIKNFRSQRWQTMLTFKTRARLLLTGTPLQNNLTELWSLLFFLRPTDTAEDDEDSFAGLKDFSEWFRKPVDQILEHGRETMDDEAREQVTKLHKVIRPYLLRRLKADVEKQMPGKYEHVEVCRLSKRQRQLYDGFMSRAQTKETLASGNYLSIINCLMQLRKVCNHPDLFETRPITTSFAMSRSALADFEIRDLIVRRRLHQSSIDKSSLEFLQLAPISREEKSTIEVLESSKLMAYPKFHALREVQYQRTNWQMKYNGSSASNVLSSLENIGRKSTMAELERTMYHDSQRHRQRPIYGTGLLKAITLSSTNNNLSWSSTNPKMAKYWDSALPSTSLNLVQSVQKRSARMESLIQKFACITPAVVAANMAVTTLSEAGATALRNSLNQWQPDPFHEARTRLSIAFPDKRLLQYDCGKLQRLDRLLRDLQTGGHRALIFTQMTKVLDLLEQFLNIHGHRYLRLDGATKIEQRQILTDRFNNDNRILAFILSSRSGGLGINLTGADTVIFYDLDWNPAMDKQCQDRCHRIGQTRDVHIYRFVSEHTIETNILRKANQKRMLDDVVIQEGDFTTDYFNKLSVSDMLADEIADGDVEASAAMDRVLGGQGRTMAAFEQVEDKEDIAAARVAEKEVQNADDGDFDERIVSHDPSATPKTPGALPEGPFAAANAALEEAAEVDKVEDGIQHIDDYMLRLKRWLLDDVPFASLVVKSKKTKKGGEHRVKKIR